MKLGKMFSFFKYKNSKKKLVETPHDDANIYVYLVDWFGLLGREDSESLLQHDSVLAHLVVRRETSGVG